MLFCLRNIIISVLFCLRNIIICRLIILLFLSLFFAKADAAVWTGSRDWLFRKKLLSLLVALSMEKTRVAKVISEPKSVSRLKIF